MGGGAGGRVRNLVLERGKEVSSMLGGQEEEEVRFGLRDRTEQDGGLGEMGEQGEKLLRERVEFRVKRCQWRQRGKVCMMVESR